jgi:2-amino-4-hydroxy-6-hydroxymethyldihydropteridine diphosphokinase
VRASLADQSLAIALGANLPSPAGAPSDTLVAVRPQLEGLLNQWRAGLDGAGRASALHCHWSPLFRTAPVGGPADQPDYCNAVLVVTCSPAWPEPSLAAAAELLQALHQLERGYGRQRRERWGPRSLDLDLLWWGELAQATTSLELPHPRWQQRGFVLAPLLAIERQLGRPLWLPPSAAPGRSDRAGDACGGADAQSLLARLVSARGAADHEPMPEPLPPGHGWEVGAA